MHGLDMEVFLERKWCSTWTSGLKEVGWLASVTRIDMFFCITKVDWNLIIMKTLYYHSEAMPANLKKF